MKRLITIICLMAIYANADVRVVNPVDTSGIEADVAANTTLITTTSNGLSSAYISADTVVSNGVTIAFGAADTVVSNALQAAIDAGSDSALDNRTATNNVSMGGFDITGGGDSTFNNFITTGGNTLNSPYGFYAYKSGAQSAAHLTQNKVTWENEMYDNGGGFDTTNDKYVPPVDGRYLFVCTLGIDASGGTQYAQATIRTNGVAHHQKQNGNPHTAPGDIYADITAIVDLTTNDYVEIYEYHTYEASRNINAGPTKTWWQGVYLGE